MEINRIKKILEQRDNECLHLQTQLKIEQESVADMNDELEQKSGENNRLRKQCVDLEAAMQDLYKSRKGQGSLQIEIDSLKADNERLLELLRGTTEYADMEDAAILKSAATARLKGSKGVAACFEANKRARGGSTDKHVNKAPKSNDWIPSEAVRAIQRIKEKFEGQMTERAVASILYELNTIWRGIMREETEAIRKKLGAQIQDLRRQVVTKQAFDKGELMNEISRTRKELSFASKQLAARKRPATGPGKENKAGEGGPGCEELERSIKMVETIGIQKKVVERENEELRSRISALEQSRQEMHRGATTSAERLGVHPDSRQVYGSGPASEVTW